jgi:pimeloyl-ACP methyl ester carboxylesterase
MVAPHFDAAQFHDDFQRLNPWGTRADVRLNQWCEVLKSLLSGLRTDTMGLFGFSGGGQFVHRYVAFHPERVHRAVAAAAGWYMWPDQCLPYPIGIGPSETPDRLTPDMRAVCTVPLLILVGDNDVAPGLETAYRGHDLIQLQGESRKARTHRWVAAVQSLAAARGWPCRLEFAIIPDTGHVLSNDLLTAAEVFLATE